MTDQGEWPTVAGGVTVTDCICGDDEHRRLACSADCAYCEAMPPAWACPAGDLAYPLREWAGPTAAAPLPPAIPRWTRQDVLAAVVLVSVVVIGVAILAVEILHR